MSELEVVLTEKEIIKKDIRQLEYNIEDKKNRLVYLDKKIAQLCKHEFINDYIDTMFPYRESILITYCKYCELSKSVIDSLQ